MTAYNDLQQTFVQWNATHRPYPTEKCIHHLIAEQAARTPQAIAVKSGVQQLSYRELDERADQLASYLRRLGVGPETLVGVMMARSEQMVVGLLGVLKAGGGYVPLDAQYPAQRLRMMVEDARVGVILTDDESAEVAREVSGGGEVEVVNVEARAGEISGEAGVTSRGGGGAGAGAVEGSGVRSENVAYVIYTSGSTGKPKGVVISHQSAVNFIYWGKETFAEKELAGVLASTSICFDLSIFEVFVTLSWGGKVILVDSILDLPSLEAVDEVTLINTVPSAARALLMLDGLPSSVRVVNLAGEALQNNLVQQIYQQANVERVLNLYGPTEDTTYSTIAEIQKGAHGIPPIGRPLANTQTYILDQHLSPVPMGATGELYIGGAGVARGYLRRPDLTAERFLPHPFSSAPGERLYCTGDLARYLADGQIEYLGRIDNQVKVRGYRIELGEIEAALVEHEAVREAVVVARQEEEGDQRLVGYVVCAAEEVSGSELRHYLKERLPEHMIPAVIMQLKELPLTVNGKVDRQALPKPELSGGEGERQHEEPQTPVEQMMAEIWSEVLRVEKVGVHDNFFELGGHSLLAVQIIARIREACQIELLVRILFQFPKLREFSAVVEHALLEKMEALSEEEAENWLAN